MSGAADVSLFQRGRDFVRGFFAFSGRKAAWAGLLVGVGTVLESFGILLVIPFLSLLSGPQS